MPSLLMGQGNVLIVCPLVTIKGDPLSVLAFLTKSTTSYVGLCLVRSDTNIANVFLA